MISKQQLTRKLRQLELEIVKLREEIETVENNNAGVSLRGKYPGLKGITYKDIVVAKGIWKPAAQK
jgi:hypothetical protein